MTESGAVMAVPVYLFLVSFFIMIVVGIIKALGQGAPVPFEHTAPPAIHPLGIFLVMHAFSAGCTALTGIEAISNGVPAFKPPEWVNARKTLITMAALMVLLFIGSIGLSQFFGIVPAGNETILSGLARKVLGNGFFYYLVQFTTLAILAVAANTSFAGFPRITAILAKDKFMPRQLFNIGDRLVFHNGIIVLVGFTALLIVLFNGDSHALVPLFAVGAFSAFTLSQFGMVVHWYRQKSSGWFVKSIINGMGALVTGFSLVVIGISKFSEGAWISVLVIPAFVYMFVQIRNHYTRCQRAAIYERFTAISSSAATPTGSDPNLGCSSWNDRFNQFCEINYR